MARATPNLNPIQRREIALAALVDEKTLAVPTEKSIRTGRVNVRGTGRADGQRRDGPRRSAVAGRDAVAGAYARPAGRSVPTAGARRGRSRMSGRSLVPVMEAAEDGSGDDARTVFRAADCAAVRRVLREREMRPRRVVVLGVPAQQSAGVALAEDDHKVEQIAPGGADHPFGEGILPRRPRRADDLLLAAEAMEEVAESLEGGATVAMDEARRFRQSGAQLDAGPLGSRVLGDVEVEDAAPSVAEDDEAVEDAKGDRRDRKEVDAGSGAHMVAQKGAPGLRGRFVPPRHVLGNRGLGDGDAELEQLAMDSRRAPAGVLCGDATDECSQIGFDRGTSGRT